MSKLSRVIVGFSLLFVTCLAQASVYLTVSRYGGVPIYLALPSLDSVTSDSFNYGDSAKITLDGFGQTSAIYFKTHLFDGNSFVVKDIWRCHSKTTLASNNNDLVIPLPSGLYKVTVSAVMNRDQCDLDAFKAGTLVNSETYESNEFMVLNDGLLNHVDEQVFMQQAKNWQGVPRRWVRNTI